MGEISLSGLRKRFGATEVVRGVDLEIEAGAFVVILGPSGCGKSTLLRLVAGLERPDAGEIAIAGRRVTELAPRDRGCAMVFQTYALYPHMTVAQNIGYALRVAGMGRAARAARVAEVAAALGLSDLLDRKPGALSGGQRQRVAMGRAMIRAPRVILYDEPLSNLDARLRGSMRLEIRRLHQTSGATSLFVTHDQVEAMTLADRIVVMNRGVLEQVGTPAEVYGAPQTAYVAGFIGNPGMNLVAASGVGGSLILSDGQTLAPGPVVGPVTVGFRAEAVRLGAPGPLGDLAFVEELGASRLVHLVLAGQEVVVQTAGPVPGGPRVSLGLDADALHFFGADGRRLT